MVVFVVPMRMVGRDAERAELLRAWSRVATGRRGRPRTVVITGGAGVGKSLLVSSVVSTLSPAPRVVLAGTARLHAPAPYDWLAAVLSGRDTTDLPVPADALAWLAQHPDAPGERYTPGALLRLAVGAVRALVGAHRAGPPALLLVEDLHAFDPASLSLVAELATVPDLPVLLIVTSRPPETGVAPHLAARTLARLASAPGSIRQHLGPLALAQVGRVLAGVYPGRRLPGSTVRAVWERTAGNPYWLAELVAAAGPDPDALARVPLPEYLRLVAPVLDPGQAAPPPGGDDGAETVRPPVSAAPPVSAPSPVGVAPPVSVGPGATAPPGMTVAPARRHRSARPAVNPTARPLLDHPPTVNPIGTGGAGRSAARRTGAARATGGAVDVAEPIAPEAAGTVRAGTAGTAGTVRHGTAAASVRADGLGPTGSAPVELTARELEVLSCLTEGMSNKQVAQSLGISIRTVTVHVSNLLRKTRSASRTEAAVWALQRR